MKRRKNVIEKESVIFKNKYISILQNNGNLIFDIKKYTTLDLLEAVSLIMRHGINDSEIWSLSIKNFNKEIDPEKSLYWLSGGDSEWLYLENYSDSWHNLYLDFCQKWFPVMQKIIDNCLTLGDIRDQLNQKLNLATIYDWSISKGFTK